MRTLTTAQTAQISAEEAQARWLVKLVVSPTTYCFTNAETDVVYDGNSYESHGFEIEEVAGNSNFGADQVRISFDNVDREFSAILLSGDVANAPCALKLQFKPASATVETIDVFDGFVTRWEFSNETASISLGSEFMLWGKKTLRLPTPNCPWSFKGVECGYSGGEAWCDKSPERCQQLGVGSTGNFGGRKFIADLEGQKIFWGPKGY